MRFLLRTFLVLITLFFTRVSIGQETYRDNFSSVSYTRNDGTQNWSGSWIETGDTDLGPSAQYIRINANRLQFHYIWGETVRRKVNLAGASSASLSFNWQTTSLGGGRDLAIQISNDDGNSYTTIGTITGDNSSGTFNQNISAYISSNTIIRFAKSNFNWENNDYAYIDNVQISAIYPPPTPVLTVNDVTVSEILGNAIFTITHSGANATGAYTVNYAITAGSATEGVDYTTSSGVYTGTINFNGTSGDTEQITVLITDDLDLESSETYTISFTSVTDTSVVITDTATGTIEDDEIIPVNAPLTLFTEFNGYFDYALTGGSLRDASSPTNSIVASSSNTLTTAVPATAQIKKAYLFWTHSGATLDASVTFENQTVAAQYANQYTVGSLSFYALFADITTLINGIGVGNLNSTTFDFSDLNIDNSGNYASGNVTLGGWSLMIFYEEPTLPAVSINLYQGFIGYQNTPTPVSFALDGFYAISTFGAKATFLSWEGDPSSGGEQLSLTSSLGTNELSGDGDNIGAVNNPFNGTIFDNTVTPNINNTSTFGLDLDTYDISLFIAPTESSVTANVEMGGDLVILNAVVLKVPSNLISGNIFEDVNYPGGSGRNLNDALGVGIPNVTVELYNSVNTLIGTTSTNSSGDYSFGGMVNGNYYIRVVNSTVKSTRGGGAACSTCYAVQTFRVENTTGLSEIVDEVGGANPSLQDSNAGVFAGAQSISSIAISNSGKANINFGFNFNSIVNTNATGQGSLEQFIINSNNLDETGLDIAANSIFDPAVGEDTSIFMIPPSGDTQGRTADVNFTSGYFNIFIPNTNTLTAISSDNTRLDGRTQTAYSSNTNTGAIGAGGTTVGTTAVSLPNYERPEIQVHRNAGNVFQVQASNTVIRNLAVYANNNTGIILNSGSLSVLENLLGVNALGVNAGAIKNGILINGGTAVIDGNYIASNESLGIGISGGTSTIIQNNHFFENGTTSCADAIGLSAGTGVVIQNNLIANTGAIAIDGFNYTNPVIISENTILNSGQNGGDCNGSIENAGIRLFTNNSVISENIINNNGGPGLVLTGGNTSGNLITQNSIFANGTAGTALGIDIDTSVSGNPVGDGVTRNDNGDVDNGPNGVINFPIISEVVIYGNDLIIEGWSRPGATIELFLTDVNEGTASAGDNQLGLSKDYGEGQLYLGSVIEGSGQDVDATSSSYTDTDANTDNTNRFKFTIPKPSGLVLTDLLTATATVANTTSEFSPISEVISYPDVDQDGIPDLADLDNDNDGILDVDECGASSGGYVQTATNLQFFTNVANAQGNPGVTYADNGITYQGQSEVLLQFSTSIPIGTSVSVFLGADPAVSSSDMQIQRSNAAGNDLGYLAGANTTTPGSIREVTFVVSGSSLEYIRVVAYNHGARVYGASYGGGSIDCSTVDTDGDGVYNYLDLDADNDGIYDAVEAGHDVAHVNGIVTGNVGADGVPDAVQASGQEDSGTTNYTLQNSDATGNNDFLEIDSDGDGCYDVLEAGYTENSSKTGELQGTGYDTTNGVVTGNSDGYTTPVDLNSNTVFDFREVGVTPTITTQPLDQSVGVGSDATFSVAVTGSSLSYQWQVSTDGGTVFTNIIGATSASLTISNVLLTNDGNLYNVQIIDGSYSCETVISINALLTIVPDSDNDGVIDTDDLDDDNDGILDTVEANSCGPTDPKIDYVIFSENFGAANGSRVTTPYTNYPFEDGTGSAGVDADLQDGEYTIFEDITATAAWASSVWQTQGDHTNGTDRMLIVNGDNTPGREFYRRTLVKVTENIPLNISFWVMNLSTDISGNAGDILPNITMNLYQGGVLVYSFNTGDILKEANGSPNAWKNYNGIFTPTTNAALEMVLVNNAPGGVGNDLALDDIEVNQTFCDADGDGIPNSLEVDSDGDGCNDSDEAYADPDADLDNNGMYGSGSPAVNSDGTVIAASYQEPADADSNSTYDFLEIGQSSTITSEPTNQTVFVNVPTTFTVIANNANSYQWSESSDGGILFLPLADTTKYSGSQTSTLTINTPTIADNGKLYRVIVTNSFACAIDRTSQQALLNVKVKSVITNRRITYRVKKN